MAHHHIAPWILLPLIPISGLLASPVRYAEGFLCWSLVGLAWLLAHHPLFRVFGWLVIAWWATISSDRVSDWQSEEKLWTAAVEARPEDPRAALGLARITAGQQPDAALRLIDIALAHERDPRKQREAHALGAHLALERGQARQAMAHLRPAADPSDLEATWALIARCVSESGVRDLGDLPPEAAPLEAVCAEALARSPEDADLWSAAGGEAMSRGDFQAAMTHFENAVGLAPDRAVFQRNLEAARRQHSAQQD